MNEELDPVKTNNLANSTEILWGFPREKNEKITWIFFYTFSMLFSIPQKGIPNKQLKENEGSNLVSIYGTMKRFSKIAADVGENFKLRCNKNK